MGYRIVLGYSIAFGDYKPLYDIALAKDYIPIVKFIENSHFTSDNRADRFHPIAMSSYQEYFKHEHNGKTLYFSAGQKRIHQFSKKETSYIIVAPTSYGKSELILTKIEDNLDKYICVIVPTKSLLAQTRKNLYKNETIRGARKRIITHPDMLKDVSDNFIAVLTQERLLRLLQKFTSLKFDIILVDEAHNLMDDDSREILTIQDLRILKKRNSATNFYYFTPFLINPEKMKIFTDEDKLLADVIHEHLKIEKYYVFDVTSETKTLKLYDQFLNRFFNIRSHPEVMNEFDLILKYASSKNIIYINRPKHIEEFAGTLSDEIEITENIRKVQKALQEFLHKDYNLINTLSSGAVYHHGGMPENVRLYVENAYSTIADIKYIITSSTLLQGVNIPAEKIFLLGLKKGRSNLNAAQFKNLCGRICRFSEVFNTETGGLKLLEPEVFLVKKRHARSNIENFLKTRVKDNKEIEDNIENPLIKRNLQDLTDGEKKKAESGDICDSSRS